MGADHRIKTKGRAQKEMTHTEHNHKVSYHQSTRSDFLGTPTTVTAHAQSRPTHHERPRHPRGQVHHQGLNPIRSPVGAHADSAHKLLVLAFGLAVTHESCRLDGCPPQMERARTGEQGSGAGEQESREAGEGAKAVSIRREL